MISKTAMGVAATRAAHQWLDGTPKILDDPIAERLLDEGTRTWLAEHRDELTTDASAAFRAHVVLRSRFAEDRLAKAVARGLRQYVSLGAGLDTFAHRQPAWASELTVYEVDEIDTQDDKRRRLAAAGLAVPGNLRYVPADFHQHSLDDVLSAAGFDRSRPAFLSWLGVTMYLEEAANDAVFEYAAALPASSELVFTFAPALGHRPAGEGSRLADMAAAAGEPWRTRYEPPALAGKLRGLGFTAVWLPSPAELAAAYFLNRTEDLSLPRRRTIVSAEK
jgi:methyltransferase (TIGR00027 family)